ncbi:MAG: prepilin-type N-terminal cleavage/methylation domain-containing protein [Steroidobacteraceae bacterium]
MPRPHPRSAGFTLVELVVVIVILGVLAAFAVPRFLALSDEAERATIDSFVGTLKSARTLAYADFMAAQQLPAGYTGPQSFTLWNLVRCDTGEPEVRTPGQPGGHYAGLNTLRGSLFRDRDENACSGNTITFTTKSGRVITITGTNGLSWSAAPAY